MLAQSIMLASHDSWLPLPSLTAPVIVQSSCGVYSLLCGGSPASGCTLAHYHVLVDEAASVWTACSCWPTGCATCTAAAAGGRVGVGGRWVGSV